MQTNHRHSSPRRRLFPFPPASTSPGRGNKSLRVNLLKAYYYLAPARSVRPVAPGYSLGGIKFPLKWIRLSIRTLEVLVSACIQQSLCLDLLFLCVIYSGAVRLVWHRCSCRLPVSTYLSIRQPLQCSIQSAPFSVILFHSRPSTVKGTREVYSKASKSRPSFSGNINALQLNKINEFEI